MFSSEASLRAQAALTLRQRKAEKPAPSIYIDPDPIRWIKQNFYIPEINLPITLFPSQEVPLREALSKDENGLFNYSTVVWSCIKKSAKSSIAAAVGLWFAWQNPWASIKIVANDYKQADSRVAYYIRRAILLHPEWRNTCKVTGYRISLPNHSFIEAMPIDPKGEAGANDDLVIYSEIWGWNSSAAQKMWTETTLSPLKYGKSMRWCETYAGFTGESPILEGLYELGVTSGECIDADYEMFRNGRLFVLWNTHPTLPWQTPEYYSQEASTLLPHEFDRVHKNQWGSSSSIFVPSEWWENCKHDLPAYEKLEPWVIALDAAISGDCFGLVAVTRRNGVTIVRHVRKWTPPQGGKIIYNAPVGTPEEQDETPAGELRRLCKRHSVIKICFDPYQLYSFCNQMREELIVFFDEFPQTTKRLLADQALRDNIRERRIWHDGNSDLQEHILNANAKSEGEADKLRIIKRKESAKIDLAVCLSMANFEAIKLNLG